MNPSEIKELHTEGILKELIPEALVNLGNEDLENLYMTNVGCRKGRYDASVYLNEMFFNVHEQEKALSPLKRTGRTLQSYRMSGQGWYRCPNFYFKFDGRLGYQNYMSVLFEEIRKDKNES